MSALVVALNMDRPVGGALVAGAFLVFCVATVVVAIRGGNR